MCFYSWDLCICKPVSYLQDIFVSFQIDFFVFVEGFHICRLSTCSQIILPRQIYLCLTVSADEKLLPQQITHKHTSESYSETRGRHSKALQQLIEANV